MTSKSNQPGLSRPLQSSLVKVEYKKVKSLNKVDYLVVSTRDNAGKVVKRARLILLANDESFGVFGGKGITKPHIKKAASVIAGRRDATVEG